MKTLRTILPTAKILDADATYAIASRELTGCERRVVGGEVRYYDTDDQYAIVSRQGLVLWFAVTPHGDVRI